MGHGAAIRRASPLARSLGAAVALLIAASTEARAQGPQIDYGAPPGAAAGASTVGQPLGAADFPDLEGQAPSLAPFSGRPGPGGSRAPAAALAAPSAPVFRTSTGSPFAVQPVQEQEVPAYGDLEIPDQFEGPDNGMTIDEAIERLIKHNLDLIAFRMEIPMADADILTASLRANPIFYADTQLIPYGHFSFLRPGGPPQSDINITYPLDITFKRRTRTQQYKIARKVTEAQLQDAVRNQIDNLYTVYVDAVAAALTVKFSERYVLGIRQLLTRNQQLFRGGIIREADVLAVRAKLELAELQVREANQAKVKANRALALMLNEPLEIAEALEVRDPIGQLRHSPMPREEMVRTALGIRPDLQAIKLGVRRSEADIQAARANAYPDVYVLYQPYTFQNNTYLGVPSAYSWTLGLTATIPLYNRNQGNITRAKINRDQTRVQATSTERTVVSDVLNAAQELEQSLISVQEFRNEIIPANKRMRDAARTLYEKGETSVLDYLEAQLAYNEVVKQYRDALSAPSPGDPRPQHGRRRADAAMKRDLRPTRCRPRLEGLEPRDLPSTLHVIGPVPGPHSKGPFLNLIVASPSPTKTHRTASGAGVSRSTPRWVNPALLQQVAASLYAPVTTTTPTTIGGQTFPPGTYSVPQPTPAEIHRETFWMEFVGHYDVGPPRFSDQSSTIHIYSDGRDVTSNQSLNARAQVLLLPPADPTASPTTDDPMAGQVAGLLSFFPANALQSGSSLFAEITNLAGVASDDPRMLDHGLPAHLQFIIDPGGVSCGLYSTPAYTVTTAAGQSSDIVGGSGGAVAFNQGGGEIDITYVPTDHLRGGAAQSGTVIVRVQGLINTTGVANALYKGIN